MVADTDIYDKPDGLGERIGTLFVGEEHPLMEPCRDDWCRVGQIELGGFPGLPNGTAWVYAKGFLTSPKHVGVQCTWRKSATHHPTSCGVARRRGRDV